jgi:Protein of unknown function (DUF2628)
MFAQKMKIYSIHLNSADPAAYENAIFISEGFNLYAFLFTGFWAGYHRLWGMMILFFALHVGSGYYGTVIGLSSASIAFLELGFRLMIGLSANDVWRGVLERKGWVTSDVIVAYTELEARHRYYERHLQNIFPLPSGIK